MRHYRQEEQAGGMVTLIFIGLTALWLPLGIIVAGIAYLVHEYILD